MASSTVTCQIGSKQFRNKKAELKVAILMPDAQFERIAFTPD
jgi:hypothetical protein